MYFVKLLNHVVELQPNMFSGNINHQLKQRLHDEVQGKFDSRVGYIVSVVKVVSVGDGMILPAMGSAQYSIKYLAILYKPFKKEVVHAQVSKVSMMGFICEVGPIEVFISRALMSDAFKFNQKATVPCFEDTSNQRIEKGVSVRIQIINTSSSADKMYCIGTMKGDCLGILP